MDDPTPQDPQATPALRVLALLWSAHREPQGKPYSYARLSKQTGMRMSVLRRLLIGLHEAGWINLDDREDGTGTVTLTPAGLDLCTTLLQGQTDGNDHGGIWSPSPTT